MSECQINLLPDDPTEEDFFGSHREVARAISDLVCTEDGGKAIALEGIWGSGKSTTVRILREQLAGRSHDGSVFVFDAWAHRGDPLRRSFIEELVRHLGELGWIKKSDWTERVEELSHRRVKRRVESEPQLTTVGKWMVLLLFVVPFGFALFTMEDASTGQQALGGGLALAPAILALGVWGWSALKRLLSDQSSTRDELNVLGLFINEVHRREVSTKISMPDPTSLEFRDIFSDLLSDGLSQSERRLVVAVDNLDRIDAHEALTIWSTMRTFFELNGPTDTEWLRRFWLLVPYDKQSLRRLWRTELEDEQGDDTGIESTKQRADAAEAFIDKSFQVRFRVSPPVRSDWREFFSERLSEALPAHASEDEAYRLYQVYSQSRETLDIRVTPRDIVLYLNQLGALHRQLGHDSEIPFEMQAVFVAFQDHIRSGSQLAEEEVVPPRLRRLLGRPRWREYLAALYYNVELDKSLQILIGEDVEQALSEGNADQLAEHREVPGFSDVCVDRLELKLPEWRESEPGAIGRAALAVDGLKKPLSGGSSERFWRSLQDAAAKVENWRPFDESTGKGVVAILENTSSKKRDSIQNSLVKRVSASCPTSDDDRALEAWVKGAIEIVKGTQTADDERTVTITVPGGAPVYVRVLEILQRKEVPTKQAACFTTSARGSELVEVLETRIEDGEVDTALADNLVFMDNLELVSDWNPLGSTVAQSLHTNQSIPPAQLEAYGLLFEELAKRDSVPGSHLEQMTQHGHLHHRLWEANQANNPQAVAAIALPIFIRNPSGQQQKNVGQASNGQSLYQTLRDTPEKREEVVQELSALISRFGYASKLLQDQAYRENATNLTSRVLAEILASEEAIDLVSPELLLEELPYLQETLQEDDLDEVLRTYGAEPSLYEYAVNLELDGSTAPLHMRVYGANSDRQEVQPYEGRLCQGLQDLSQDQWDQQLDSEGALLQLTLQLLEKGAGLTLKTEFRRALQDHLTRVLDGNVTPDNPEIWRRLLDALEDHALSTLLGQVVDQIATPTARNVEQALAMYGEVLLTREDVLVNEAEDVIGNLSTGLIQRRSSSGIRWIRRMFEGCPQVWESAPEDRRGVLKDDLRTELDALDSSADVYEDLRAIAMQLNLSAPNGEE